MVCGGTPLAALGTSQRQAALSAPSQILTLPLCFLVGLETFSQLVWRSPEGTVSGGQQKGLLLNL